MTYPAKEETLKKKGFVLPYTRPVHKEGGHSLNTLVAVAIAPFGQGEHLSTRVAQAIAVIRKSGLTYRTNAMFTEIEGPWDDVMALVKDATFILAKQGIRTEVILKADIRPGYTDMMTTKVARIDALLGDGQGPEALGLAVKPEDKTPLVSGSIKEKKMRRKTVLAIAGSDSSGGAGIQADIKALTAHGVFAMTAITALTAQNSKGVSQVAVTGPDMIQAQLQAVADDMPIDAIKIGMVADQASMEVIADFLKEHPQIPVVLDPVMVASSGSSLMESSASQYLRDALIPLATLVTPNIPEAQALTGLAISTCDDMEEAATAMGQKYPNTAILLKGGHLADEATDILYRQGRMIRFTGARIASKNNHGTGCTLSSTIAGLLAQGQGLEEAVRQAKDYVRMAMASRHDYTCAGPGPLDHMWHSRPEV